MKILIIEDDSVTLEILSTFLEKENYKVNVLSNGKNILNVIEKVKPNLLITDLFMPEVDGIEVIATVKEHHPNLPIFAISSNTVRVHQMSLLCAAKAIGVDKTFSKPIQKKLLLDAICDFTQKVSSE